MRIRNNSRKIIAIENQPLLPNETVEIEGSLEEHPELSFLFDSGMIVDVDKASGISDEVKNKIIEDAMAGIEAKKKAYEEDVKAVSKMKKPELLIKAAGMGIEVSDDETADSIREKIVNALN